MHVLKKDVLHLCKLEIRLIQGGSKFKTIMLRRNYRKGLLFSYASVINSVPLHLVPPVVFFSHFPNHWNVTKQ